MCALRYLSKMEVTASIGRYSWIGGWRIQILFNERGMIEITHWKKQKHVPRTGEPELFQFEWQLTLVLDSKVGAIYRICV